MRAHAPLAGAPGLRPHPQHAGPRRRGEYEAGWARLESLPAGARVRYGDVPWLLADAAGDADKFKAAVLAGVEGGPAGVRARLRQEVLRW